MVESREEVKKLYHRKVLQNAIGEQYEKKPPPVGKPEIPTKIEPGSELLTELPISKALSQPPPTPPKKKRDRKADFIKEESGSETLEEDKQNKKKRRKKRGQEEGDKRDAGIVEVGSFAPE